ncbi:MAG: DUF1566 domain-containing protein [Elusimicrobia bacterium]|nr:DUF1566 domain-containing protein [Elusimicrobiota bacterium]
MNPAASKARTCAGWLTLAAMVSLTCFWAFWGIKETFHEGWYYDSLPKNIVLSLAYLGPMFAFLFLGLLSVFYPRITSAVCLAVGIGALFFFQTPAGRQLIAAPVIVLCAACWFGRIENKRPAAMLCVLAPMLVLVAFGLPDAIRVAHRVNDGNFGARLVEGNGVRLIWAPQGPGWPAKSASWREAREICAHLSEDGLTLSSQELNIWRLPTVEEAVRSLVRHGENAGGVWNPELKRASYRAAPDKETPLWNPHSSVIYWWTATESDADRAYFVVYNGGVFPRKKSFNTGGGYQSFRAVKKEPS